MALPTRQQIVEKPVRIVRMIVAAMLMRLTVDTSARMFYPFLPEISRGLGISLAQGGLLMSLLVLPLYIPTLIYGADCARRGAAALAAGTPLLMLVAITLGAVAILPFAAAAAIRVNLR